MKKYLLTFLLAMSAISQLSPCGQDVNIRKAFVVIEHALRNFDATSADRALCLYYAQIRAACDDCCAQANILYGSEILKLERMLEPCDK